MFPDFFDKPLEILGLSSGKGIFHTLLFAFISFLILYVATKGNKSVCIPFLIGILLHLPLDEPQIPYFWPFFSYQFVEIHENPIEYWAGTSITYLYVIITEIIGGLILIFILIQNKLYGISKVINYLKTNPNSLVNKREFLKKEKEEENVDTS